MRSITFASFLLGLSSCILLIPDDCSATNFSLAATMLHGTINAAGATSLYFDKNKKGALEISPKSMDKVKALFRRGSVGTKKPAFFSKRLRVQSGSGQQQQSQENINGHHQIVPDEWKSSAEKMATKMERLVLQITTVITYFIDNFNGMGPYRSVDFEYVEFAAKLVANAMVAQRAGDGEWWWMGAGGGGVQEEEDEMEEEENGKKKRQQLEAMDGPQGNGAVGKKRQKTVEAKPTVPMVGGGEGGQQISGAAKNEAEKRVVELRQQVQYEHKLLNTPQQDQKLIEAAAKLVHALHEADHILKHSLDIKDMEKMLQKHQIPLGNMDKFKSLFDVAPLESLFDLRWKVSMLRQDITTTPLSVLRIAAAGRNYFDGSRQQFEEAERKLNRAQILVNKAIGMVDEIFGRERMWKGNGGSAYSLHRTMSAPAREGQNAADGEEEKMQPNWRIFTNKAESAESGGAERSNHRRRSLRRLKPKKTGFEHLN